MPDEQQVKFRTIRHGDDRVHDPVALEDREDVRVDLIRQYFDHIHDKHHSLFHRPSAEQAIHDGTMPRIMLLAMMALGARFTTLRCFGDSEPRQRGRELARKAARLLDMSDISLETIQACVLLGTIAFAEANMQSEALYYSVATRLALILDLPHRTAKDVVERQVNLRVYWTLYMIDIWSATGLHLPRQLNYTESVDLPVEEGQFLSPNMTRYSQCSSIWGEMASLARIWAEIHEIHKAAIHSMEPVELNDRVAILSARLQNWSVSLAPHLVCTEANLTRYAALDLGSAFAALHLGYHYYSEVLFYQFLAPAAHHPSISTQYYANSCKGHARQFCDLLYLCHDTPKCKPMYVMVGHMLVVTSTVYIHQLLFCEDQDEVNTARARLERNFEILTELQMYWTELDVSLKRLMAFHNACQISSVQSFRLDRWMLSFLLQHGIPIAEKFVQTEEVGVQAAPISVSEGGSGNIPADTEDRAQVSSAETASLATRPDHPHDLTLQDWYRRTFAG